MAKEEVWRTAQYLKNDGTLLVFDKYEVSNMGQVRSLDYNHTGKAKILRFGEDNFGYYQVVLRKDKKRFTRKIHRLVASTFLEAPEDLKLLECINHKDENKHNNNAGNLEWCTVKYNDNYGTRNERQGKSLINHPSFSKPTLQIDPDTLDVIAEYPSAHEAARIIGSAKCSVLNAIRLKEKLYGYIWRYK